MSRAMRDTIGSNPTLLPRIPARDDRSLLCMSRSEWSIAWRFARRLFRSRGASGEMTAIEVARAELGRPLPLTFSAVATRALWNRNQERDELYALRRRRHEWEFCRWNRA